ncbi:hypothetical protein K9M42_02485 [Patescibacteria group bacterium]|nr:hypothetical protein [Patescibacteria group bacterium]
MLDKIIEFLEKNKIKYKKIHHKPTPTSEDSARERGEDIKIGGKALILKINKDFKIFVLSASFKLDSKKVKKYLKAKKIRFATKEELFELTGLVPGAIPPFGKPIINLDFYIDESILNNEKIAFNAGSLEDSIIMDTKDYIKIAEGKVFKFSL